MKVEKQLIEYIERELQLPLPGEDAQYRMAPEYRKRYNREEILASKPKISAVMVLLYPKNDELNLVFTQRWQYAGVHSGQMSFPGGKKDDADTDLIQTAYRETLEEIGVEPAQIRLIGKLSELYIPPSHFLVYPVVGYAEHAPAFKPQVAEVEKVVEIPLSFFLDKKNINANTEIKLFNDTVVHVPAYIYNGHIIWGATAIMLSEFTVILENALKKAE